MTVQYRLLDDIKAKTDIVDFISAYVPLKKSGQNWKGICPFHAEKTPSFMVSPSKQIFHCFGCSSGGDVITFIAKYDNLSFHDAVEFLAKKAGIPYSSVRKDSRTLQKDEQIRKALGEAAAFFMQHLKAGPAREYLLKRGVTPGSIEQFRLGYAPADWHSLTRHLKKNGHSEEIIREAGLAAMGKKGMYDLFRHRIIFPITSTSGQVIAFGGRAIDDTPPKYLNSPETPVFKKSDALFGLSSAKEEIVRKSHALLVEGYMDAIMCHQHGFFNVVAPLGTSLTAGQAGKLRTLTDTVVLVFDGDAAGTGAARRALSITCRHDFRTKILLLPEKDDPDSYLRRLGAEAFRTLIGKSMSIPDFLMRVSSREKTDTVREALACLVEIKDLLLADSLLTELADRSGTHEATVRQQFQLMKTGGKNRSVPPETPGASRGNPEEYLLLSAVLAEPDQSARKSASILSKLASDDFRDKAVFSLLNKLALAGDSPGAGQILERLDDQERLLFTKYSVTPDLDLEYIDKNIEDCLRRIAQKKIHKEMLRSDAAGDPKFSNSLLRAKKKLIEGASQ